MASLTTTQIDDELQGFWDQLMFRCHTTATRLHLLQVWSRRVVSKPTRDDLTRLRTQPSQEYRHWVDQDSQCGCCRKTGPIVAHHIIGMAHGGARTAGNNIFPICRACHQRVHHG